MICKKEDPTPEFSPEEELALECVNLVHRVSSHAPLIVALTRARLESDALGLSEREAERVGEWLDQAVELSLRLKGSEGS